MDEVIESMVRETLRLRAGTALLGHELGLHGEAGAAQTTDQMSKLVISNVLCVE